MSAHSFFILPWKICKLPMYREGCRAAMSSTKWPSEPPKAQNDLQLREIKKCSKRRSKCWARGTEWQWLGGVGKVTETVLCGLEVIMWFSVSGGSGGQFAGLMAALHPLPAWGCLPLTAKSISCLLVYINLKP